MPHRARMHDDEPVQPEIRLQSARTPHAQTPRMGEKGPRGIFAAHALDTDDAAAPAVTPAQRYPRRPIDPLVLRENVHLASQYDARAASLAWKVP